MKKTFTGVFLHINPGDSSIGNFKVDELENGLPSATWERINVGIYEGTFARPISDVHSPQHMSGGITDDSTEPYGIVVTKADTNKVWIKTYDKNGQAADHLLQGKLIEIHSFTD